jgi:hypothetical protein
MDRFIPTAFFRHHHGRSDYAWVDASMSGRH